MVGAGLECLMKRNAREIRDLAPLSVEHAGYRGTACESDVLPDIFRVRLKEKVVEKVAGGRLAARSLLDDERWVRFRVRDDIGQQLVPGGTDVSRSVFFLLSLFPIGAVLRGGQDGKQCPEADERNRDQFPAEMSNGPLQGFSFRENY